MLPTLSNSFIPSLLAVFRTTATAATYDSTVVDHFNHPRNVGTLDAEDPNVGTALVGAPACGDVMRLQIKVDDDGNIVDAKFKTFGCGSAIASSSYVTDTVRGMNIDDASKIRNSQIATDLRLPPVKVHCSVLAEDAIKGAIDDLRRKGHKCVCGSDDGEKSGGGCTGSCQTDVGCTCK